MPRRIHILPDHVANQIAAGEVVERPASVVKELVENSLDAAATRIGIQLRAGGKREIRVADDGCGMGREDALLAVDRHATSKIRAEDDLRSISTLGFRGEALPSIAAVSRFELESAPAEGGPGTRIRINGGRVASVDEVARQPGTTVTVRSLFFNVPARAKFARSTGAETRAVSETVTALALSNLSAAFNLTSNGRELLELPRTADLESRIAAIWGSELAEQLIPVDRESGQLRIAGLVQRPAAVRRGTRRTFLFVNGRPFVDRFILRAAEEGYRTTIPEGFRPALFLYLDLPPDRVDVNVHPTKAEVRFRDKPSVEKGVTAAVRSALERLDSAPEAVESEPGQLVRTRTTGDERDTEPGGAPPLSQLAMFVPGDGPTGQGGADAEAAEAADESRLPRGMWQVHQAYILAETRSGLLIVDQHSAHERVLFEQIMRQFRDGAASSQRLLFPITVRLSAAEFQAAREVQRVLEQAGFELEPFGGNTIIIHAVPRPHPYFDPERCFQEMIGELTEGSPLVDSARNQHERVAKSFACKGAIKAGQALSQEEMAELFDQLFATELPGHDVHGRPTILRLPLGELERRFGRT